MVSWIETVPDDEWAGELGQREIRCAATRPAFTVAKAATSTEVACRRTRRTDPAFQQGPTLTAEDLSAPVYTFNVRMGAAQVCTQSIATAVDDHVDHLEAAACEIIIARASMTEFRVAVQEGQDGAAAQIKQLFDRADAVLL